MTRKVILMHPRRSQPIQKTVVLARRSRMNQAALEQASKMMTTAAMIPTRLRPFQEKTTEATMIQIRGKRVQRIPRMAVPEQKTLMHPKSLQIPPREMRTMIRTTTTATTTTTTSPKIAQRVLRSNAQHAPKPNAHHVPKPTAHRAPKPSARHVPKWIVQHHQRRTLHQRRSSIPPTPTQSTPVSATKAKSPQRTRLIIRTLFRSKQAVPTNMVRKYTTTTSATSMSATRFRLAARLTANGETHWSNVERSVAQNPRTITVNPSTFSHRLPLTGAYAVYIWDTVGIRDRQPASLGVR